MNIINYLSNLGTPRKKTHGFSCQTCPPAAEILPPQSHCHEGTRGRGCTRRHGASGASGAWAQRVSPWGRNPMGVQLWQLWFKIGIPPTNHCPCHWKAVSTNIPIFGGWSAFASHQLPWHRVGKCPIWTSTMKIMKDPLPTTIWRWCLKSSLK